MEFSLILQKISYLSALLSLCVEKTTSCYNFTQVYGQPQWLTQVLPNVCVLCQH